MGTAKHIREREFQIFIKPTGPRCNLGCSYCYYLGKSELYPDNSFLMDDETLENIICQQIEATTEPVIIFSWHGGEPLLTGIDFYRKALKFQRKFLPAGKKIINGIQTNGTLIDEEWASFLSDEKFLVGLSIDGPQNFHDHFRKQKSGKGTFDHVLRGFDLLVLKDVEPEILCVVNDINSKYPVEIYNFFRQLGVSYLTFIPLVERVSDTMNASERSVHPEDWGRFLCTVFDLWMQNDIGQVKVQIFEEALRTAFKREHTLCIFKPVCGGVPVIEHNGDFYSCDHFVAKNALIGNIAFSSISDMLDSEPQKTFGKIKSDTLPEFCKKCEVLNMCNGECPKNRFVHTPEGEKGLNYLCNGYRQFFNHCRPFVNAVEGANRRRE